MEAVTQNETSWSWAQLSKHSCFLLNYFGYDPVALSGPEVHHTGKNTSPDVPNHLCFPDFLYIAEHHWRESLSRTTCITLSSRLLVLPQMTLNTTCNSLWMETFYNHAKSLRLCPTPAIPWTVAHQATLSMGFSRQGYWSGLPCPPPGDLPDSGIEPMSLISLALTGKFFTTSATWEAPSPLFSKVIALISPDLCP